MSDLKQREAELEAEAARINSGRKPKFGDRMLNPWAGEGNPKRIAFFLRAVGKDGYEFTDGEGDVWLMDRGRRFMQFVDAAPASAASVQPPIGVADPMPGTSGFTMACFKAAEVPVGTNLYAAPVAAPASADDARDAARWRFIVADGSSMAGRFTLVECVDDAGRLVERHGRVYNKVIDAAIERAALALAKGSET